MPTSAIDRRSVIKLAFAGVAAPLLGAAVPAEAAYRESASPPLAPAMCAELHIADDPRMPDFR